MALLSLAEKARYHVALNSIGLILRGAPERLAYRQDQLPIYGNRFASGDRTYNDLSLYWYLAQSDWSGGIKDEQPWEDDARYYFSSNVDAYSEPGVFKLARAVTDRNANLDTDQYATCGVVGDIGGTTYHFVGTSEDVSVGKPQVHRYTTAWGSQSEIYSANVTSSRGSVSQLIIRSGVLWVLATGTDAADAANTWDGSSWVDQTAYIADATVLNWTPTCSRAGCVAAGSIYLGVDDFANNKWAIVRASVANPAAAASWTKVVENTASNSFPISIATYGSKVYYVLYDASALTFELRAFSIADASDDSQVAIWRNITSETTGVGDKLLVPYRGKLIVTVPDSEVWSWDGSILSRVWRRDAVKYAISDSGGPLGYPAQAVGYVHYGAVEHGGRLHWGNLVLDGDAFHNGKRPNDDSTDEYLCAIFVDASDSLVYFQTSTERYKLWYEAATYRTGFNAENAMVMSLHDKLVAVDKLGHGIRVFYRALAAGQRIEVSICRSDIFPSPSVTGFTTNITYTNDAGTTSKFIPFGDSVTYQKVFIIVSLESSGADTPVVTDVVHDYLPVPVYQKQWTLNVNAADEVDDVKGRPVGVRGRELRARLESAWWTKSFLDFQDLDYAADQLNGSLSSSATTVTVDSTATFPEQGRIKVDDEEILYAGKTPTTFTGCTRGARGTRAVAHSDNAAVHNGYKVFVSSLSSETPLANEGADLEYSVSLVIRES